MQQAESSRDTVQRRKNSCLRDAFVFFLWHTSRCQPIAVIGGRFQSRADNLQRGTVEAGRVTPCTQERLTWSQVCVGASAFPTPSETLVFASWFYEGPNTTRMMSLISITAVNDLVAVQITGTSSNRCHCDNISHSQKSCNHPEHLLTQVLNEIPSTNAPITLVLKPWFHAKIKLF